MSNSAKNESQEQKAGKPRKKGGGGGALFILLLLVGGLAFFFYQKQNSEVVQSNSSKLEADVFKLPPPPISSLNFPKEDQTATKNEQGLSQNQPFNYKKTSPQPIAQIKQAPEPAKQVNNSSSSSPIANKMGQKATNKRTVNKQAKPATQKTIVRNRKFAQQPTRGRNIWRAEAKPLSSLKIPSDVVPPNYGLLPGSLVSFLAYPSAKQHFLAVQPDQIISFRTVFYEKTQALDYATRKLISLGFSKIKIPIDDYSRGGSTVLEGVNKLGNQAYFSFKSAYYQGSQITDWKLEFYKNEK